MRPEIRVNCLAFWIEIATIIISDIALNLVIKFSVTPEIKSMNYEKLFMQISSLLQIIYDECEELLIFGITG